jgi:hypothetical protein
MSKTNIFPILGWVTLYGRTKRSKRPSVNEAIWSAITRKR